jgi:arabinogalactan oligomer/maltooligosaccharide transport system substrate-binding protein
VRVVARLAVLGAVAAVLGGVAGPATAGEGSLVIWVPTDRAAAVAEQLAGGFRGMPVTVVAKSPADLRADLATADLADAPDLIWAENAWTGELAGEGLVVPVPLSQGLSEQFPGNILDGFQFGFDGYGVPVAVRNMALVTNLDLVPRPPASFAELERRGLALVAGGRARVPLAVGQGPRGSAVVLGPLFSGIGGYLFGRNSAGSLDPYNVGIASPALLANAAAIDRWNDTGVLDGSLTPRSAMRAFVTGRAPYWITGTWSAGALGALPFPVEVTPLPAIVEGLAPAPFLGIEGVMVTRYAEAHGRLDAALTLARRHFTDTSVQAALAAGMGAAPARSGAAMGRLVRKFSDAGRLGVAMPNIPQADLAWGPLADAWQASTRGADAVAARVAFAAAQRDVLEAVG